MKDVKVGQMGELSFRIDNNVVSWEYVVAIHVYDDRIVFLREYGGQYMHVINVNDGESEIIRNQETKYHLNLLYKNESPVFSKRNIFGKYTFEPRL